MPKVTPVQAAEKWNRRLKGATQDIQRGVENMEKSPTEEAAKKSDKMRANILASIDNGKWAAGLRRVSKADWQDAMITKGIPRIAQGADAGLPKMEAFMGEFFPHIAKVQAEVNAMPDMTLEDNINRMVHNARRNAEFKRRT